jgi:transposase-like protein
VRKVPPSERTREAIRELLEKGVGEETDPKSELMRLATQLILEEALEGKARDVVGRDRYQRRGAGEEGYRNGYRRGRLKSSEGAVEYAVPQLRDVSQEEITALRRLLKGRTEELERLAVEMYARGCSTRDIEAMFTDEEGRSLLSRTAVSEITEVLWSEYEEFATRDLSEVRPLYLFLDGVAERLRPGAKREAVLAAWCLTEDCRKVLLHVSPGTKESTDCCCEFLEELKRRGLPDPVLVATDGAPGLIRAVEQCFPASLRQRCLAHKMRNIGSKVPEELRVEFKEAARAAYQAPSPAMARALRDDLMERYEKAHPSAVACFLEDFEGCIAHLRCPPAHRRVIRTTNLLERLFGEERRRVRAAGTMFGERPVLKLMYAALVRAADRWRGIRVSEFESRQLEALRQQLTEEHAKTNEPVTSYKARGAKPSRLQRK